nr:SMR family transporter [Edaphovirga cremea]
MNYLLLSLTILAEVIATTALKASDSFTRWLPSVLPLMLLTRKIECRRLSSGIFTVHRQPHPVSICLELLKSGGFPYWNCRWAASLAVFLYLGHDDGFVDADAHIGSGI